MRDRRIAQLAAVIAVLAADLASVRAAIPYWQRGLVALFVGTLCLRWIRTLPRGESWLCWDKWRTSLWWTWRVSWITACVCAPLLVVAYFVAGDALHDFEPPNVRRIEDFWPYVVHAVLWAPLVEELVYRGYLHPRLRAVIGVRGAILVGGFVFWVVHWVGFGHVTFPNHLLAGLLFHWVYERTRSLVAPTLLHALGNLALGLGDVLLLSLRG